MIRPNQPPILLPGGGAVITGEAIADAVLERLRGIPLLAPVIDAVVRPLRTWLSATCGSSSCRRRLPSRRGRRPAASPVRV